MIWSKGLAEQCPSNFCMMKLNKQRGSVIRQKSISRRLQGTHLTRYDLLANSFKLFVIVIRF